MIEPATGWFAIKEMEMLKTLLMQQEILIILATVHIHNPRGLLINNKSKSKTK